MAASGPSSSSESGVKATAIAANLRILSVQLDGVEANTAAPALIGRVERIVALFIEKHWRAPRRFLPILGLSYVLYPGPEDPTFAEDVDALTAHLERHLFGEGVEIKCLIGEEDDIAALSREPEIVFRDAHAAANEEQAEDEPPSAPRTVSRRILPAEQWTGRLRLFAGYDAPRSAVLCYVASLGQGDFPSALVSYDDLARSSGARHEDLEIAALKFAARKVLSQTRSGGAVCYCLVPLSYETLADRRLRDTYVRMSGALPEDIRRFILPSIFGGPAQPSSSFLMEIVSGLRTMFSHVDWRVQSCAVDPAPLKNAQLFATTLVLPASPHARTLELARLPEFVRRLSALRMRSGVTGVATRAEVEAVLAARAHYLSGPAISAEMPDLAPRSGLSQSKFPLAA